MLIWLIRLFYRRPKFAKWMRLETIRSELTKAVETNFTRNVFEYVSTALSFIPIFVLKRMFWSDAIDLFYSLILKNSPSKELPILKTTEIKDDIHPDPWEYVGHNYFLWSHLIYKSYGWTQKVVDNLDVDIALSLIQEILTAEQLEREFDWRRSEIAYQFNSKTKTTKFIPLPRPYWMKEEAPPIKKYRMLRDHIPMGNVIDSGGMKAYFEKQVTNTKETQSR